MSQDQILIIDGVRTPFGKFGGSMKGMSATDMAVSASQEALTRSQVDPEEIEHVVFGNVVQTSPDAIYLARHVGLKAGVPVKAPAVTVNRMCGSGFQAPVYGAMEILGGDADFVLAGGTESMSQAPHSIYGARWGIGLGQGKLYDTLWDSLTDSYCKTPMGMTAENLAEKYEISREEVDAFAYRSQQAYQKAKEAGHFEREIMALTIPGRRGKEIILKEDEHPRAEATLEGLSGLPPVFKEGGTVTAGNASGICDGAVALVLGKSSAVKQRGLKTLGRIVSWASVGCEPHLMGIGPAEAIRRVLVKTGLSLEDMDLIEVNEAFSPQYLAVEKELGLNRDKTNINGGAIAMGHPLGATGSRIMLHALLELQRSGGRYAMTSACIGGGQGMAVLLEASP